MSDKVPHMTTDVEAEDLLDRDLSGLDFKQFQPVRFELREKDARVNMRLPTGLLDIVKARAAQQKVPYQRLIRDLIERGLRAGR
jgi:predicted DNA binding CopG/RHH family protein